MLACLLFVMPSRQSFGATDAGLLFMAVIWGINFSVVKVGIETLDPFAFNGLRVTLAAVVLVAASYVLRKQQFPSKKDVIQLFLLGILGNGVYQLFFILGMARTRAGIAALIMAAGPAYIALILHFIGRERLPGVAWGGIALQLIGVGCVVGSTQELAAGSEAMLGAGLIAMGSLAWAVFSVALQPYTTRAHPIHLSSITMVSGAMFLSIVAVPALQRIELSAVGPAEWGAVVYAGLGALVIAYLLYYRGVKVLGPTRTAMYGNLQPLIALAVAWVTLHEVPTAFQLLGAAFIMCGLLLSRTANVHRMAVVTDSYPAQL